MLSQLLVFFYKYLLINFLIDNQPKKYCRKNKIVLGLIICAPFILTGRDFLSYYLPNRQLKQLLTCLYSSLTSSYYPVHNRLHCSNLGLESDREILVQVDT